MDYDTSKFVLFELSLEEILMLKELLRFETLYQVGLDLHDDTRSLDDKITRTFTMFQGYRYYDDILGDMYAVIKENQEADVIEETKSQNLVMIAKQAAQFYLAICINTVKLALDSSLLEKASALAPGVVKKIESALVEHSNAYNNNPEDLKINIMGIQGLA